MTAGKKRGLLSSTEQVKGGKRPKLVAETPKIGQRKSKLAAQNAQTRRQKRQNSLPENEKKSFDQRLKSSFTDSQKSTKPNPKNIQNRPLKSPKSAPETSMKHLNGSQFADLIWIHGNYTTTAVFPPIYPVPMQI